MNRPNEHEPPGDAEHTAQPGDGYHAGITPEEVYHNVFVLGKTPTEYSRERGVSRQAIDWHMNKGPFALKMAAPKTVVQEAMPWQLTKAQRNTSAGQRVTLHASFMAVGGSHFSQSTAEKLTKWYRRLLNRNEILVYRPNGDEVFHYVPRTKEDGDMIIREDEHTQLSPAGRVIWRIPPVDTWPGQNG